MAMDGSSEIAPWRERAAQVGRWALLLAFAALPIKGELVPLPLVTGIVLLLPQVVGFAKLKDKALLLLPMAFYLLHVVGMAWTSDIDFGLFDLEVKLSLLLLPLVAAGMALPDGKDLLRPAMAAFSVGLVVAMLLSMHASISCYLEHGWMECFTQSYLSAFLHPSYLAWYACWALFYWGRELLDARAPIGRWRVLTAAFLLLLLVYIVMLASKSGLIGLAVVAGLLTVHAYCVMPRKVLPWLTAGLAVAVLVPGVLLSRVIKARVGEAVHAAGMVFQGDHSFKQVESSSDERLAAWNCSVDCLKDSPWGAGTGDIKHALMDCYRTKGATAAVEHNLNSHSQVLQSGVALGWPGFLLVCALMFVPLVMGIVRKDPFLAIFALLFIINGAIESVLEVQAGVVFFILFYVVLVRRSSVHRPQPTALP
ncbi:MAG: O-antigen ligase family protein [Flavobacteriales bacterium]|nr:O-antigen ligase family protein [Flavobacteriales bacterium]